MSKSLISSILAAALITAPAAFANNPKVGAGEAGYITWQPFLMAWRKGGFENVIIGPTTYGWQPFHYVWQKIDLQAKTYSETFDVIDKKQIKIHFEAHFLLRPESTPEHIRTLVEHFGGADWYNAVVRQPLRTFVRDAIGQLDSQTISSNQDQIEGFVDKAGREWLQKKQVPIRLEQVSVGNFQFPTVISEAAAEKQANLQRLEAKSTLLQIAQKDADIKAAEADGIRRAQEIINQTLSPIYVQHEMVRALEAIAGKAGNTIVYVPISPDTGLPIVADAQVRRIESGKTTEPAPAPTRH